MMDVLSPHLITYVRRLCQSTSEEINDYTDGWHLIEVVKSDQILKHSTAHIGVWPTLQLNVEDCKDALVENLKDQIDFEFAAIYLHIMCSQYLCPSNQF